MLNEQNQASWPRTSCIFKMATLKKKKKINLITKVSLLRKAPFLATALVCFSSLLILVGAQFTTWLQSHCTYQPLIQKASSCFQQISYNKHTISDKASW